MRLVAVRIERPAQAERPVGVRAGCDGGQAEGSVRFPRAHPHHVRVLAFGYLRRVAAAVGGGGGVRVVTRRRAIARRCAL